MLMPFHRKTVVVVLARIAILMFGIFLIQKADSLLLSHRLTAGFTVRTVKTSQKRKLLECKMSENTFYIVDGTSMLYLAHFSNMYKYNTAMAHATNGVLREKLSGSLSHSSRSAGIDKSYADLVAGNLSINCSALTSMVLSVVK
jgi:hypothetical protein